jgi:ankyrin repeat protein
MLLNSAASNGHVEVAKLLLEMGADVEKVDQNGWTPLYSATYNGHAKVVKLLLDIGKVNVESKDEHGRTPRSWMNENASSIIIVVMVLS